MRRPPRSCSVASPLPARGIQQRVGSDGVEHGRDLGRKRAFGGHRPVRDAAVPRVLEFNDARPIDGEVERLAHAHIIKRRPMHVEHDAGRKQNRIVEHTQSRVALRKRGHTGRDTGVVEITTRQPRKFGAGLVDHRNDKARDFWRPAERRWKGIVAHESPQFAGPPFNETERPIPNRLRVERRASRARRGGSRASRCAGTIGSSQRTSGTSGWAVAK